MKKTRLIVSVLLIVALAFSMCACGKAMKEAAELQVYDFDSDQIPTINSQVGEREVTGVETGTNNGAPQKQYTYKSDSVFDDLMAYTAYLRDNGWIVTADYNLEDTPGSAQLGKESADAGQILIISIAYEADKYAVKITKMEGTLTRN